MSKALARKIFGQLGTLGSLAQVSTGQNVPLVLITGQAETRVSHKQPGQNILLVLKEQMRQYAPAVHGQMGQNILLVLKEQARQSGPKVLGHLHKRSMGAAQGHVSLAAPAQRAQGSYRTR